MQRMLKLFLCLACCIALGPSLAGCASWQLNENTLDVGGSVGTMYTNQVLSNLAYLDLHPNTLPSIFSITNGEISTKGTVGATFTLPLGNTVTRTVVANGISEIAAPYTSLGLPLSDEWTQKWMIAPLMKPRQLMFLRAGYLLALQKFYVSTAIESLSDWMTSIPQNLSDQLPGNGICKKPYLGGRDEVECRLWVLLYDLGKYFRCIDDAFREDLESKCPNDIHRFTAAKLSHATELAVGDENAVLRLVRFTLEVEETGIRN